MEDCGSDSSRELLKAIADDQFGALFMSENVGQHRAYLVGLQYVDTGHAGLMDGDLQDRPESLPILYTALSEYDVVFAQRSGRTSMGSALLKGLFRLLSGGRLPPKVGTNMVLGSEAVRFLQGFSNPDPYLIGILALSGLSLSAVEVERDPPRGPSSYNLKGRVMMGLRALRGSGLAPWLPVPIRPGRVKVAERWGWPA